MKNFENKLPKEFEEKLNVLFGEYKEQILSSYALEKTKTTFRVNVSKVSVDEVLKVLDGAWISSRRVDFLPNAIEIEWQERLLWDLDIYKNWDIYIQSISSQIPVEVLNPKTGEKILDMTAAPWWKTTQIADKVGNSAEIIACERSLVRYEKMKYNFNKQGFDFINSLKIDSTKLSEKFENEYFDKILLDSPCSWEGRFNLSKPKSFAHWSPDFVKNMTRIQKFLLKASYPLLKKWGELVYSTCTLSPEENEAQVHMMLSCFPDLELMDISLEIPNSTNGFTKAWDKVFRRDLEKTLRILPLDGNEWFFIARFRKKD